VERRGLLSPESSLEANLLQDGGRADGILKEVWGQFLTAPLWAKFDPQGMKLAPRDEVGP
jgi:hypothetical protein